MLYLFGYVKHRYAKVKSGDIRVENFYDYVNRKVLQARDEEGKGKDKKRGKK